MVADDWMGLGFVFGVIVVATVVVVVVIRQMGETYRSRKAAEAMADYRKLAEESAAVQREIAAQLADMGQSLAAVKLVLRDVE